MKIKTTSTVILIFFAINVNAQQDNFKKAWLEKWNNSRDYLIAIAEAMPEEHYDFKPAEREMSFKAQLQHIQSNMIWLGTAYFTMPALQKEENNISKEALITSLKLYFNAVYKAIEQTPEKQFKQEVTFFAGPKSKYQILNLLQDHVTHHRGQLIVYLNLNDVKPPAYIGW